MPREMFQLASTAPWWTPSEQQKGKATTCPTVHLDIGLWLEQDMAESQDVVQRVFLLHRTGNAFEYHLVVSICHVAFDVAPLRAGVKRGLNAKGSDGYSALDTHSVLYRSQDGIIDCM